jgi:hypothetical protein
VGEYTGADGNSAVAIYAHVSATAFAGTVANQDDKVTGMQPVSGIGGGAFFLTAGGRSVPCAPRASSVRPLRAVDTGTLRSGQVDT